MMTGSLTRERLVDGLPVGGKGEVDHSSGCHVTACRIAPVSISGLLEPLSAMVTGLFGGDDRDVIETKARALAEASAAVAQQAYASAQSAGQAGAGSAGGGATGGKDDVLDAEFEEVKDKDGKAS